MKKGTRKKAQAKAKTEKKDDPKSNVEYYTKEELERLDSFHAETNHKFNDEEIYELMEKYGQNDDAIKNELQEQLKERERGDEFNWQEVGKSN